MRISKSGFTCCAGWDKDERQGQRASRKRYGGLEVGSAGNGAVTACCDSIGAAAVVGCAEIVSGKELTAGAEAQFWRGIVAPLLVVGIEEEDA